MNLHTLVFLATLSALPATIYAHHGQDFLVTLGAELPGTGSFLSATGLSFSSYSPDLGTAATDSHGHSHGGDEWIVAQTMLYGLSNQFNAGLTWQSQDLGSGSWADHTLTPFFQWEFTSLIFPKSSPPLRLALAFGYEIALNRSNHDHGSHPPAELRDCSSLVAVPALYQACLLNNASMQNHTHDHPHAHNGIHRHGETHGFFRLIAETSPAPNHRLAANFIGVLPESGSIALGYAAAWRYQIHPRLATGLEFIGDFNTQGEHLAYLTSTLTLSDQTTFTLGIGTPLSNSGPDHLIQALLAINF